MVGDCQVLADCARNAWSRRSPTRKVRSSTPRRHSWPSAPDRLVTDEPRPKSDIREDCGEMMKHAARRPPDFALACRSRHVHTLRLAHLGNAVEATRHHWMGV